MTPEEASSFLRNPYLNMQAVMTPPPANGVNIPYTQLAGDVIPGPWGGNPASRYPLGTYGMKAIDAIQRGVIRGRGTDVDLSNIRGINRGPTETDAQKYQRALLEQLTNRGGGFIHEEPPLE